MICGQFNTPWQYLEFEIPWWKYYILFSVALDTDERGRYWEYLLAGGESKKWKWSSEDKAGTIRSTSRRMWNKITAQFGGKRMGGDLDYIAQSHWKRINKVTEKMSDGSERTRYEDEKGNDITKKVEKRIESGEEMFFGGKRQR